MNSKKGFTLVEIMIVVVIIGLLAAMAIPAFNKVRETSQQKAVLNNLRQIASAASQYFVDAGVTEAAYDDLVGTNKYVKTLNPVAGESYKEDITWPIEAGFTEISISVPSLDEPVVYSN